MRARLLADQRSRPEDLQTLKIRTARGDSACQRRRRKLVKPTSAPDGRPLAEVIDFGRPW